MSTVAFLSWHYKTPEILLNQLRRMTPGNSGKWLDMEAITDYNRADVIVVLDGCNQAVPLDRTIFVGQHPKIDNKYNTTGERLSPAFRTFEDRKCLARVRLDKHWNPGEVWIPYDYDYLKALSPNGKEKAKKLVCISTYQTHNTMYSQRVTFLREFFKGGGRCDLYGRPSEKYKSDDILSQYYKGFVGHDKPEGVLNQHVIGKELVGDYQYSIEMDVGPTTNYISERFYDALLLWTFPIYFGSTNLDTVLPAKSFYNIDIYTFQDFKWLNNAIDSNELRDWGAMANARELLLDKMQLWPYMYNVINNLKDFQ